jgi:hypothetical protein
MCADEAAMEWAKAWKSKGPAPQRLGFIYMLNGDNGTSNTDPFATEETRDNNWIKTRLARDDRRRQARPEEALCNVAGNALRTFDAPGQVRMPGRDCDPALISAMGTSRLEPSRRRCSGQGWLRASSTS